MIKPKNIPLDPGVYQFKDKTGKILYVGKAKNLKNRVESYFSNQLGIKTRQMVDAASSISFIKVQSEFQALLLEANLIKKYKPKYNIELKDDKSPLYIGITNDYYPRVITFRKPELKDLDLKDYFGPFLFGVIARKILKIIRRIFPFSTHLPTIKICIYKQLGLCDPCPSEIENTLDPEIKAQLRKRYLRNVRNVKKILNGKMDTVINDLKKDIKIYSSNQEFEEAREALREVDSLENISLNRGFEIEEYLENPNLLSDIRNEEIKELEDILKVYFPVIKKLARIECFDIAHLSGSFPTASMVTFVGADPDKKYYRHFKIYQKKKNSDVDSMREVITRRLKHIEDWGRPDLIIIDGGKPQLTKVHDLLESENIPFIGLAKRLETIVIYKGRGQFVEIRASGKSLNLLQRIRDEAHRFARRLHHKQVRDSIRK